MLPIHPGSLLNPTTNFVVKWIFTLHFFQFFIRCIQYKDCDRLLSVSYSHWISPKFFNNHFYDFHGIYTCIFEDHYWRMITLWQFVLWQFPISRWVNSSRKSVSYNYKFEIEILYLCTPNPGITRFPLAWFPLRPILAYVRAIGGFLH